MCVVLLAWGVPCGGGLASNGIDGLRERMLKRVMLGLERDRMCESTAEPTRPVAPVRMRCTILDRTAPRRDQSRYQYFGACKIRVADVCDSELRAQEEERGLDRIV